MQGLVNPFKELRCDKSVPRAKSTKVAAPQTKGKSPGITKPVMIPQLQVCIIVNSLHILLWRWLTYIYTQVGEDSVSYERHIKQLQAESSKMKSNPPVVSELMRKTFPQRTAEIMEQPSDLIKMFERFPFLQEIDQVSLTVGFMHRFVLCTPGHYLFALYISGKQFHLVPFYIHSLCRNWN